MADDISEIPTGDVVIIAGDMNACEGKQGMVLKMKWAVLGWVKEIEKGKSYWSYIRRTI